MRSPVNRNLNQRIRQALYQLKKDYGAPIDIYRLVSSETDARTGNKVVTKTVTHVRRAVVVPSKVDRIVQQTISVISANKQFVTGGHYDSRQRDFIIDRRDVPALPDLTADDWIVYNRHKYQVKTVEEFEVDAGWVVAAQELVGEVPEYVYDLQAESYAELLVTSDSPLSSYSLVGESTAVFSDSADGEWYGS